MLFLRKNAKKALFNFIACDCCTCRLRTGFKSVCPIRDLSGTEFSNRCNEERYKNLQWMEGRL